MKIFPDIPLFIKTSIFFVLLIGSKLKSVTYTAVGCPGPVTWSGFSAAGSPFYNGGTQLTSQPAAGSILVIPAGCTLSLDGNITANNTVTLEIYGQLYFADSGDKLDLSSSSSKINIYSGGSISGASNSNQIKIGSGGAEWSGPGTASGPFEISNGSNTLPIELIEFKAVCETQGVLLTWSTATELNNDYFAIERSVSGNDWLSIAKIDGGGTRTILKKYSYSDELFYEQNNYYYRLRQVDFDESNTLSNSISVSCKDYFENEMLVFPNPAHDEMNVKFKTNRFISGTLKLIDVYGNITFEQAISLSKGINSFSFPLTLDSGLYKILFSGENKLFPTQKLIVLNP